MWLDRCHSIHGSLGIFLLISSLIFCSYNIYWTWRGSQNCPFCIHSQETKEGEEEYESQSRSSGRVNISCIACGTLREHLWSNPVWWLNPAVFVKYKTKQLLKKFRTGLWNKYWIRLSILWWCPYNLFRGASRLDFTYILDKSFDMSSRPFMRKSR